MNKTLAEIKEQKIFTTQFICFIIDFFICLTSKTEVWAIITSYL